MKARTEYCVRISKCFKSARNSQDVCAFETASERDEYMYGEIALAEEELATGRIVGYDISPFTIKYEWVCEELS